MLINVLDRELTVVELKFASTESAEQYFLIRRRKFLSGKDT